MMVVCTSALVLGFAGMGTITLLRGSARHGETTLSSNGRGVGLLSTGAGANGLLSGGPNLAADGRYPLETDGNAVYGQPPSSPVNHVGSLTVIPQAPGVENLVLSDLAGTTSLELREAPSGLELLSYSLNTPVGQFILTPSEPTVAFPARPHFGGNWVWRLSSADGATTLSVNLDYVRASASKIAGHMLPVEVFSVHETLRGVLSASGQGLIYFAPSPALPVRIELSMTGRAGDKFVDVSVLDQLTSEEPT